MVSDLYGTSKVAEIYILPFMKFGQLSEVYKSFTVAMETSKDVRDDKGWVCISIFVNTDGELVV